MLANSLRVAGLLNCRGVGAAFPGNSQISVFDFPFRCLAGIDVSDPLQRVSPGILLNIEFADAMGRIEALLNPGK